MFAPRHHPTPTPHTLPHTLTHPHPLSLSTHFGNIFIFFMIGNANLGVCIIYSWAVNCERPPTSSLVPTSNRGLATRRQQDLPAIMRRHRAALLQDNRAHLCMGTRGRPYNRERHGKRTRVTLTWQNRRNWDRAARNQASRNATACPHNSGKAKDEKQDRQLNLARHRGVGVGVGVGGGASEVSVSVSVCCATSRRSASGPSAAARVCARAAERVEPRQRRKVCQIGQP